MSLNYFCSVGFFLLLIPAASLRLQNTTKTLFHVNNWYFYSRSIHLVYVAADFYCGCPFFGFQIYVTDLRCCVIGEESEKQLLYVVLGVLVVCYWRLDLLCHLENHAVKKVSCCISLTPCEVSGAGTSCCLSLAG